ncbi:MAG TPA: TIGR02680 family protein [Marmoricola sp.]|nr:TIGR02680 family protein [Marmoricola sp.]
MTTTQGAPAWSVPHGADPDALPHPTTERWQPLRLGLVDLFYYDDEQFWFHDGRLLLRGNNGTGKSKVLALTLPFLLDGSVLPRRVEPDADPKKRMEWNLLLGGAHASSERTGYSWIEFGRVDADGTEHFTTLGIGLKAAAGRGIVKTWYFTTSRRIGDLRLLDVNRTVLSAERLRDALAEDGQVHATQEAYRRAIDEALFRLGEERYAALIDLLIQLRQPQLSKRPDEKALSAALTEALAPLDQAVVADVAESFRSLEEERAGIADARDTLKAAEEFLKLYRTYARVAARRHTTAVRLANSAFEHAGRNLRTAEEQVAATQEEEARLDLAKQDAGERQGALQGQEKALRESPEMRDAARLEQAETAAADRERAAVGAATEAERARVRAARDDSEAAEAVRRHEVALTALARHDQTASRLADQAGLAADHPAISGDENAARRALTRRREQVAHVRRFAERVRAVEAEAVRARSALDVAEAAETARAEQLRAAVAGVEEAVSGYRDRVRHYLVGLSVLVPSSGPDELAQAAEDWGRSLDGESPVRAAVETAASAALDDLGRRKVTAEHERDRLDEHLGEIRAEIADLEAGRDPEPPAAPGREPSAREGAPGAPLWRLTDFADEVPDTDRAGIEAALQSAGLLDAWLFPDGTLSADGDVVLGSDGPEVRSDASLARLLAPAVGPDAAVPAAAVAGVLARVGLGEDSGAALWVDAAGRWGAGPARGTWTKERAEYVGAGAREATRRQALARLRSEETEVVSAVESTRARVAEIERATAEVDAERAGYPASTERDLAAAHERVAAAGRELELAQAAEARAQQIWEKATAVAEEAAGELADAAADLGTGTTLAALDAALAAVNDYSEALVVLRTAAQRAADAEAAREVATERAAEATTVLEEREGAAREVRTEAATLRAHADALRATVGASVSELERRLGEITVALKAVEIDLKRIVGEQLEVAGRLGTVEEKVRELGTRREEAAIERERVIGELRGFAATGLLRVALADLEMPGPEVHDEWNVTAALAFARGAEHELDGVDESDDAWSRAQQRTSTAAQELSTQMSRHGHTSFLDPRGEVVVARVRYLSEEVDVDLLAVRLADDLEQRERLLSAREREILENHLVNEVAGELHELLLSAEAQIDGMNAELADRKTSTGMQLRVRWRERTDGPAGLAAARDLMVRSDATWTPADRSAIGEFLQARIAEVRQADPTGGWAEHLEQALDYRQWHSFAIERWQNGKWRSATGPASGGERALAMSVPLFAAASSHYNSAGPHAPRLILLDEAFAGVDDDSRAKSLGLLATFDLDVVMTSEREWGCYPQVPGLAIAQLSRVEGVDAVGVTRWQWNGSRRTRLAEVDGAARAGGEASTPPTEDSLFG